MCCSLVAMVAAGAPATAGAASPLRFEDLLSTIRLSRYPQGAAVAMAPDGRRIAYTTSGAADVAKAFDPRGPGRKQLWIVSIDGTHSVRIGSGKADNWAPVWSPDGQQLAYYSDSNHAGVLSIWNSQTGESRPLHALVRPTFAPVVQWLPDSRHLIVPLMHRVKADADDPAQSGPVPTPRIMKLESIPSVSTQFQDQSDIVSTVPYDTQARPVDIGVIDSATGAMRVVAAKVKPTTIVMSPDGRKVLYTVNKGAVNSDINSRLLFDVVVVDIASRKSATVATNILTGFSASSVGWSHDDSALSFVGGVLPGDSASLAGYGGGFPGHVYVVDLRHPGPPRRLGDALLARLQPPLLWSDDNTVLYGADQTQGSSASARQILKIARADGASSVLFALEGGSFDASTQRELFYPIGTHHYILAHADSGAQDIYDVDLASGDAAQVFHAPQKIAGLSISRAGKIAAYAGESASQPADVWLASAGFAQTKQITHLNPQIEGRALGRVTNVSWEVEGQTFFGSLLLPGGYETGKQYPMIVWVYAGTDLGTRDSNLFGASEFGADAIYFNLQLYASRGYAVFIPNSTLRDGTPMRDIASVILPGVDKVVAMGVVDPERLGVMGQSYGGYSTLSLIVQTTRFKAAVATSGISDLVSMYGTLYPGGSDWTSWSESEQGRIGGTPWQYRDRYIENSPFFFLDRVETPLLLEYGAEDTGFDVQADEAFVGLRRLGKPAVLVGYAGEGHVVQNRTNQLDLFQRISGWFDLWLKERGAPVIGKYDHYKSWRELRETRDTQHPALTTPSVR